MRTTYRVVGAIIALTASLPIGMPAAHADTAVQLPVAEWNWYWQKQQSGAVPVVNVGSPGVPAAASGIKDGNLAVAVQPTQDKPDGDLDKATFLRFEVGSIPAGSIVDTFAFTLTLDKTQPQQHPVNTGAGAGALDQFAVIVACKPLGAFAAGNGAAPFAGKPTEDCTDAPSGQYDPVAGTFRFDVSLLAQKWVDGTELNLGVEIRNAPDYLKPFQYSLLPAATVKAEVSYRPKPEEAPVVVLPPAPDTGYAPTPNVGGGFVSQPQPQPQAPAAPRPVVPLAPQRPRPINQIAAVPIVEDGTPTRSFWAAAIAGALLLGVASLVLGDPTVAPVTGRRETKLDQVMRRRAVATEPVGHRARPRVV